MKKIFLLFIFLGLFNSFLYAKTLQPSENLNPPLISVSTAPQAFFVKKILEQKFPKVKIIDMQKDIPLTKTSSSNSKEILDPFAWFDPILVQNIALNTYNALVQKYPQNKSLYKHNLDKSLTELDVLNLQISSKLQKVKNKDLKNRFF